MKGKEKEVDGDISYLPQEIIRNILKRLPIKSLIRFQCVCREWRNLFKTQSFITEHLNHSNRQNPCLLIQHYDYNHDPWTLYCIDSKMQVSEFQNPPPSPLLDYFLYGKMIGSSNGLLCVHRTANFHASCHSLLVWNPSIREIRLVPEIKFHVDYDEYFIEFGFSPIINDYKIVILCVFESYAKISEARVYSLTSGSWKKVRFRPNDTALLTSDGSVAVNGVMFWLGSMQVGSYENDVIVSFDLANEVFTLIPMPEPHPIALTVYEEKLAIVSGITDSEDSIKNLCVMEEGTVGASEERWGWTKRYIGLPYQLNHLTIWRNEIVCWTLTEGEPTVVLFNPTTKKIKELATDNYDGYDSFFNYVQSIVPVGGMKSFTNSP